MPARFIPIGSACAHAGVAALTLLALAPALAAQGWQIEGPRVPLGSRPAASPAITAYVPNCDSAGDSCAAGPSGIWIVPAQGGWRLSASTPANTLAAAGSVIYAGSGSFVLGGGGSGVLISRDDGVSWSASGARTFSGLVITRIAVDPASPAHLFASAALPEGASSAAPGLYRSNDGGASWQLVAAGQAWDLDWDTDHGVVIAAVGGALLRSTDNGGSFAALEAAALPAGFARAALAQTAEGAMFALLRLEDGGAVLVRSGDEGATWAAVPAPPDLFAGAATDAIAIGGDAQGGATLLLGGRDAWRTSDSGVTWNEIGQASLPANQRLLATGAGGAALAGNDGGLYSSDNTPQYSVSFTNATPASAAAGATITLSAQVSSGGQPAAGVIVQWAASAGSAPDSTTTNSQGVATASFTLPTSTAAPVYVYATAGDVTVTQAIAITPLGMTQLVLVSGGGQQQSVGTRLQPIVVAARDQNGNGVGGQTVAFSDGGAGGSFSPASGATNSAGQASSVYTLPQQPGTLTLQAASGNLSVDFTEVALSAPAFSLVLGAPGTAQPNQQITFPLQVVGLNGFSGAVSLVCVQPVSGCTVSPESVAPGGAASVSVSTGSALDNADTFQVVVLGSNAASGLQQEATANVALTAFSLAAPTSAISLSAGGSANSSLTVTGVNGFAGTVTFSATNADGTPLPAALSAVFSPAALGLSASTTAATTVLSLGAQSAAAPGAPGRDAPAPTGLLALVCLALGALLIVRRWRWLPVAAAMVCLLGCGGGTSTPAPSAASPAAVYSINLIATSGSIQATQTITVTVNP